MNFQRTRNAGLIAAAMVGGLTATSAMAEFGYFESFENATTGWSPYTSDVNQVASGTNGINATDGSFYGLIGPGQSGASSGAFDTFGANNATFGLGFTAGTDVYIDLSDAAVADGTYGFDFTIAINDNTGSHAQDNIFHVGAIDDGSGGFDVAVNASHNTDFGLNPFKINNSPFGTSPATFIDSGWYTFQVSFTPGLADAVDVLFEVSKELDGSTLFSAATQSSPAQYSLSTAGGDRYGWLTYVETENGLALDSTFVTAIPSPAAAGVGLLGILGLVMGRRRTA
jgi:hypothetical protein